MSNLEKELKRERKSLNVRKAILATIGAAGLLSLGLVAGNAIQVLKIFNKSNWKTDPKYYVKNSLTRLLKLGLVEFVVKKNKKYLQLTNKGRLKLIQLGGNNYKIKKPKKWDKKWRVIVFDIPQNKRRSRDLIRFTLKQIGFVKLQHSVWVYPYDCEEWITLLKLDFKFGKEVLYMIVEKIENDKTLRQNFGLVMKE